jgi:hypothetical protein
MVKGLHLLGPITAFFIVIYILRLFLLKREGFFDAQTDFLIWIRTNVSPLNAVRDITDTDSTDYKVIRESVAMINSANARMSATDLATLQTTVSNKLKAQPNPSTAYTLAVKMKWPAQSDPPASYNDTVAFLVKKLHKALPSYPFNQMAMDILKAADSANRPTMEQCKKIFKCSSVESIPANI